MWPGNGAHPHTGQGRGQGLRHRMPTLQPHHTQLMAHLAGCGGIGPLRVVHVVGVAYAVHGELVRLAKVDVVGVARPHRSIEAHCPSQGALHRTKHRAVLPPASEFPRAFRASRNVTIATADVFSTSPNQLELEQRLESCHLSKGPSVHAGQAGVLVLSQASWPYSQSVPGCCCSPLCEASGRRCHQISASAPCSAQRPHWPGPLQGTAQHYEGGDSAGLPNNVTH